MISPVAVAFSLHSSDETNKFPSLHSSTKPSPQRSHQSPSPFHVHMPSTCNAMPCSIPGICTPVLCHASSKPIRNPRFTDTWGSLQIFKVPMRGNSVSTPKPVEAMGEAGTRLGENFASASNGGLHMQTGCRGGSG